MDSFKFNPYFQGGISGDMYRADLPVREFKDFTIENYPGYQDVIRDAEVFGKDPQFGVDPSIAGPTKFTQAATGGKTEGIGDALLRGLFEGATGQLQRELEKRGLASKRERMAGEEMGRYRESNPADKTADLMGMLFGGLSKNLGSNIAYGSMTGLEAFKPSARTKLG